MSMINDIIDDILVREGGGKVTDDPLDNGGKTQWGISEKSNPEAWKDGVVTEQEARDIYYNKYVKWPKFDLILDPYLQAQLVDFGVNSGPTIAIQTLQTILYVKVDGVIGERTLTAIRNIGSRDLNNALVGARVRMIGRIVSKNPSQVKFINGWLDRALSFMR